MILSEFGTISNGNAGLTYVGSMGGG